MRPADAASFRYLWRLCRVVPAVLVLCSAAAWIALAHSPGVTAPPTTTPGLEAVTPRPAEGARDLRKIEPALLREFEAPDGGRVRIIVELSPAVMPPEDATGVRKEQRGRAVAAAMQRQVQTSQAGVLSWLEEREARGQVSRVRTFWVFNGIAAEADQDTVLQIAKLPEVRLVRRDSQIHIGDAAPALLTATTPDRTLEWNLARIRTDMVWSALRLDGSGVVVANVDTGVDWLHPALHDRYRGYDPRGLHRHVCNWFDATGGGASYPVDSFSHGTHTMGTAVGGGGIGVAPGAQWIAVRAFSTDGSGLESWLHSALQWVIDPGPNCSPPDVVFNSWSTGYGDAGVFRSDVQALRAAGIVAPFAAGNEGPDSSTIRAPASYPEALAVGAVAPDDTIATFSSRGPSVWYGSNRVKPDISAPGVNVRSSVPGGGYGEASGTSMATPHVAGVAALMLAADPQLSVVQVESILTQTATRRGSPIPNNDHGWGRLDAYAAVATVAEMGTVHGTVKQAGSARMIAGASVVFTPAAGGSPLSSQGGGSATTVRTDGDGHYEVGLASGIYAVNVSAFGHADVARQVTIVLHQTVARDFALTALPTGVLTGRVTGDGRPIRIGYTTFLPVVGKSGAAGGVEAPAPAAAPPGNPPDRSSRGAGPLRQYVIVSVAGTPVQAETDRSGVFTLVLPAGRYTVTVTSPGHRVAWASDLPVTAGNTTRRDFDLAGAPTILLVDSGAWYYDSQIATYRQALDDRRYQYDVWTIGNAFRDVPAASDLMPYDIVFWSAPQDSPGYVGAGAALGSYLSAGGALFLSGQDIAYYDDHSMLVGAPYFQQYIKARFVTENTTVFGVAGAAGSPFEGMSFAIKGMGGADNQATPDVIRSIDTASTAPAFSYVGQSGAGQVVSLCQPYRALFLGFGFEGITGRSARAELVERSIEWLTAPRSASGLEMTPQRSAVVGAFGATVTHTWQIRNTGEGGATEQFVLAASGAHWPTRLLTVSLTLAPCAAAPVAVAVRIPSQPPWAASDAVTVTARSAARPGLTATAIRHTRTPAPVLLVDDDRWYEVGDSYRQALHNIGMPFDEWAVQQGEDGAISRSPPFNTLSMYPMVVWFSGYDWFEPLTTSDEDLLNRYLAAGGRLFYSGQDYLLVMGQKVTAFARDRLGVLDYADDVTSTQISGLITSPLGSWMPAEEPVYPYTSHSDALTPTTSAAVAFVNQDGRPLALINAGPSWHTAFFAFNPDGLAPATRQRLLQRTTGWLSWLGTSSVTASRAYAREGATLTYTVRLRNDGPQSVSRAHMTATFTSDLAPVPGSIQGGGAWDAGRSAFVWSGPLAPGQSRQFTYRAAVAAPQPAGKMISHTVWIGYDDHFVAFDRIASTRVNAPRLDQSTLTATGTGGHRGQALTYTLRVRNSGTSATLVTATNLLPVYLQLNHGSLQVSEGAAESAGQAVRWRVTLAENAAAVLTYTALITGFPPDRLIRNRFIITDALAFRWPVESVMAVAGDQIHLPLIAR